MTTSAYVFDGTRDEPEYARLRALERAFDEGTRRALGATGLRAGWRCLEVGAGAGSVATWMSEVVGATGHVAAVDPNARFLREVRRPNLDVHESTIEAAGLPPASFDLAHARFVFIHVPGWQAALEATLALLKPGGWLVLEEPDFSASRALAGPSELRRAFEAVHLAIEAMFAARGLDHGFGARLPAIFQERGLGALACENDAPLVAGGAPIATMMGMSTRQLGDKYVATGRASEEDVARYGAFAADPGCWAIYHGTIRAAGRRRG